MKNSSSVLTYPCCHDETCEMNMRMRTAPRTRDGQNHDVPIPALERSHFVLHQQMLIVRVRPPHLPKENSIEPASCLEPSPTAGTRFPLKLAQSSEILLQKATSKVAQMQSFPNRCHEPRPLLYFENLSQDAHWSRLDVSRVRPNLSSSLLCVKLCLFFFRELDTLDFAQSTG